MLTGVGLESETAAAYLKVFSQRRIDAVLAEYGETGVQLIPAIERSKIPLIVHFHGYDASVDAVLEEHRETYPQMFRIACAIVAVSKAMKQKLLELGAPPEKTYYNPYGVDCDRFAAGDPASAPPILIAVGRFTEKKAPHVTISAFAKAFSECTHARLRMIGDGPLLADCKVLAKELGVNEAITFLGAQPHSVIEREMRSARCFVQHSVRAASGDCEGTPLSILEAGATGLPVVSTRHGGISDVVTEGETGFLVDEGDEVAMAKHMIALIKQRDLAGNMGAAARRHICENFSKSERITGLWRIIQSCLTDRQEM